MQEVSPGWYPDPTGRSQQRYWDGAQWTGHVATNGQVGQDAVAQEQHSAAATPSFPAQQNTSPTSSASLHPGSEQPAVNSDEIAAILAESSVVPRHGDGTVFGEPVVIVDQSSMDSRSGYRYELFSSGGALLAECAERIESFDIDEVSFGEAVKKYNTDSMEFRDPEGRVWASLTHRKVWKSKISVTAADGSEIGQIAQQNVLGRVKFEITAQGGKVGALRSTGTRLKQFDITDQAGNHAGRLIKLGNYARWRPLRDAKAVGRYVLEFSARLPQPLATLAVVAPVAIDLAFNMDQAGYRSTQ
jgi:hypothetical protein